MQKIFIHISLLNSCIVANNYNIESKDNRSLF